MGALLAICLGLAFLHAFYRTVESQWPVSYNALTSGVGFAISATPLRYLAFRFGPMFITSLFAAVSLGRAHQAVVWPIVGLSGGHVALTTGRASIGTYRRKDVRMRAMLVMYLVVAVGIVGSGLVAVGLDGPLGSLVPPLHDITSTLWTGLVAAIVGAYLVLVSQARGVDTNKLLADSKRSIAESTWAYSGTAAFAQGVEVNVVRGFMLAENLQRPAWFRRLENAWGRFGGQGTYGILQIRADRPLSDIESIDAALSGPLAGCRVPTKTEQNGSYSWTRKEWEYLDQLALSFNPSKGYAELVQDAYRWLEAEDPEEPEVAP